MSGMIVRKQWYLINHLKELAKKHGASRQEIHEIYVRAGVQYGSENYEQWREDEKIRRALERQDTYHG